jgi:hypothetical protein
MNVVLRLNHREATGLMTGRFALLLYTFWASAIYPSRSLFIQKRRSMCLEIEEGFHPQLSPARFSVALQPNQRRCLKSLQTCGNYCNALQMTTARMSWAHLSPSRERWLAVGRILVPIEPWVDLNKRHKSPIGFERLRPEANQMRSSDWICCPGALRAARSPTGSISTNICLFTSGDKLMIY